jgi:hypothetical protein
MLKSKRCTVDISGWMVSDNVTGTPKLFLIWLFYELLVVHLILMAAMWTSGNGIWPTQFYKIILNFEFQFSKNLAIMFVQVHIKDLPLWFLK